ncbi:MAG TPA: hypothetical protein GXZ48_07765 [Acholeplasmataceae bacterium]|nr:hypothetical protein [Acholeplasmataceae bacterium]
MKLITEIKSLNLDKYNCDGLIFSYEKFHTISNKTFTLSEIENIVRYCKKNNLVSILKIDKIFSEFEIKDLFSFLDQIINLDIDYYLFSDMSVLTYMKRKKLENRLIYCAKTLNCSYFDSLYYQKLGIKVMLSNELTLEDIKEITELNNIVLDGYGYSTIFYSKRKLLSLFAEHISLEEELKNRKLYIREKTRNEKYPIYENANGTFIFTSYKYVFYKELEIVKNLFMFKIESLFIEEEDLFKIIDIYKRAINGNISEEDYSELVAIDNNIGHSFLYEKPMILKRDKHEEN